MIEIVLLVSIGFLLGGILKGATGAGAPLIAVPLLTLFYDAPTAITYFAIPNLIPNVWQAWHYRQSHLPLNFTLTFATAGCLGAIAGTFILVRVPAELLSVFIAFAVFVYIGIRLLRSDWQLEFALAKKLAAPIGALAGILQGASGISAPVSISFLNALRLDREKFVATISVYFIAISVSQIPLLLYFGLMTAEKFLVSCAALIPLLLGMPIGNALTRRISPAQFDKVILLILAILAFKLLSAID